MENLQIEGLGSEDFEAALYEGLRPDPDHTITSWAAENIRLTSANAAEPGPYDPGRTPYLRRIQDALSPSDPCKRVVLMKGTQIGGSQTALNTIGFYMDHAPCPIMFVQKTEGSIKRFSKQRVAPMIEASETLRKKVQSPRSRDSGNTMFQKDFDGGTLIMVGANSAVNLRSMPARVLLLDEVDSYDQDSDDEGNPIKLAERRQQTFGHRRKTFLNSTPLLKGRSRIEAEFEAGSMEYYHVPCPFCGHKKVLKFDRLKWEWGKPETVRYECEHCAELIDESHKEWMFVEATEDDPDRAEWIAEHPEREDLSFHLSSLYSAPGWLSWAEIAAEWEEAQADLKAGKIETLKTLVNTILAETWEDRGDAPDWHRLYDRREDWPVSVVPEGGLILTAFTDVQGDRLETSVWAWGQGFESWLIEHRVIVGEVESPETWAKLDEFIRDRKYRHWTGHLLQPEIWMVDSGAYTTQVYAFVRTQDASRVFASKGQPDGKNISWRGADMDDPKGKKRKVGGRKILNVATSKAKKEFYRQLRLEAPTDENPYPAGYVHLSTAVSEDGCRQLVSEVMNPANGKWDVKQGERNEWLDCRVGCRAGAYWAGVDFMGEDDWDRLREQFSEPTAEQVAAAPERHKRRQEAPRNDWLGGRGRNWLNR